MWSWARQFFCENKMQRNRKKDVVVCVFGMQTHTEKYDSSSSSHINNNFSNEPVQQWKKAIYFNGFLPISSNNTIFLCLAKTVNRFLFENGYCIFFQINRIDNKVCKWEKCNAAWAVLFYMAIWAPFQIKFSIKIDKFFLWFLWTLMLFIVRQCNQNLRFDDHEREKM